MPFHDEKTVLTVGGSTWSFMLRTPERPADRPALLIYFARSADETLNLMPFATVPGIFAAAGHYVASFDLPQHAERIDEYGEGMVGMANAVAAGQDIFAGIAAMGRAVVDECVTRHAGEPGQIVTAGTSRGAIGAFHLLAHDPRIIAGAGFAPITDLPAFSAFSAMRDSPIIQRSNAMALVPRIANRPVFIAIKEQDVVVSTDQSRALIAALQTAAPGVPHELRIEPGDTHTMSDASYQAGGAWLLDRLKSSWATSGSAL